MSPALDVPPEQNTSQVSARRITAKSWLASSGDAQRHRLAAFLANRIGGNGRVLSYTARTHRLARGDDLIAGGNDRDPRPPDD
jgi:hypothetical protein